MALSSIEEGVAQRIQEREEAVTAQIITAQERRDQQIATLQQKLEERREQAGDLETALRGTLRDNLKKVLTEDMVYEPTGEVVVQQGAVVDATHLEALDRVAQEHRDLVVETSRKD